MGQAQIVAGPTLLLPADPCKGLWLRNLGLGLFSPCLVVLRQELDLSLLLCPLHSLIHSIGKHVLSIGLYSQALFLSSEISGE